MHRTQILLEDDQYERLKMRSQTSGQGIGELVRRAVDQVYGTPSRDDLVRALEESHGVLGEDDLDHLDGAEFVERLRRGLDRRLAALGVDDRR